MLATDNKGRQRGEKSSKSLKKLSKFKSSPEAL